MKKTNYIKKSQLFLNFCFLLLSTATFSQQESTGKDIEKSFKNYTQSYQEIMYAHVNKTKFVRGESIGFTVYAFNKRTKSVSTNTSNIYAVITDKNNQVVAEQMIKAEKGIANGDFTIDETFTEGTYNIKVFTNWMMNFSKEHFFVDSFEVISINSSKAKDKIKQSSKIDIQFLPESGHLLHNVMNTIGVVAKDSLGYGIKELTGEIFDSKNRKITDFKLNKMGIGRFSLTPKLGDIYMARFSYNGQEKSSLITTEIKKQGVLLKVSSNAKSALVSVISNDDSKKILKNKKYKLTFHDGTNLKVVPINFSKQQNHISKIPLETLSKGINVFTLFNENNKPVAERLFFNFNNLKFNKSQVSSNNTGVNKTNINLQFDNSSSIGFNNVSISILPKGTKSYTNRNNIISQTLLKPYLKGFVENSSYYFTNIDERKKHELDNLLITQGWSSYDWKSIFNYKKKLKYTFDEGISVKVNVRENDKKSTFLIHAINEKSPEFISFDDQIKSFTAYKFYPESEQDLYISKIGRSGKLKELPVYAQFMPNSIPNANNKVQFVKAKPSYFTFENFLDINKFMKLNKREVLDEVVITANREEQRKNEIISNSIGRVKFLRDIDRNRILAEYLDFQSGIRARDNYQTSSLEVTNTVAGGTPSMFLNDSFIFDMGFFFMYSLNLVEYIEINTLGIGPRAGGVGGTIKIYDNPKKYFLEKKTVSKIKFPLTFSKSKKFYVPEYASYRDRFYKDYGVIDWLPINKINENGNLNISFDSKNQKEVVLFIEGITADGTYIIEEKTLRVN